MMENPLVSLGANLLTAELLQFVHKLADKYVCPVCKLVLRNAMQLPCGHQICEPCIDTLFGESDNATCPVKDDEYCEEPFPKNQVNKLLFVNLSKIGLHSNIEIFLCNNVYNLISDT